jgi:hypothetical protein
MKKGMILAALLVGVLAMGYSAPVQWQVNSVSTWVKAVGGIRNGGNGKEHIITVTGKVAVPDMAQRGRQKVKP